MTRKKITLAFIRNEAQRKATLKKRKQGLIKKISQLATLCGIEACAIVYSPHESDPEVWPSPDEVQQVLTRFNNMLSMEKGKKMMNHESYLRLRIEKLQEKAKKQWRENRARDINQLMFQGLVGQSLLGLNMMDLNDLSWRIDETIKDILKRDETFHNGNLNPHYNIVINNNVNNNNFHVLAGARDSVVATPMVPMHVPVEDTMMVEVPTQPEGAGAGAGAGVGGDAAVVSEVSQPLDEVLERPPGFEMIDKQPWFMQMMDLENQIHVRGGQVGGTDELPPFTNQNESGFDWLSDFFP